MGRCADLTRKCAAVWQGMLVWKAEEEGGGVLPLQCHWIGARASSDRSLGEN
jgi:hypothetical protein